MIDPKIKEAWQWAKNAKTREPWPWHILANAYVDAEAGRRMAIHNSRTICSYDEHLMPQKTRHDCEHANWTLDDWKAEVIGELER